MIKIDKDSIIMQYEESGKLMYQATLDGDYRTNNREGEKLIKIFKILEQNRELAGECIAELLKSSNPVIQTKAAAYCLALRMDIKKAENTLKSISNNPHNGIFAFNAKMTLQTWYENGKLEIYPQK